MSRVTAGTRIPVNLKAAHVSLMEARGCCHLEDRGGCKTVNMLNRIAVLVRDLIAEDPSLHVYRELQTWDGEKWVSQFALPAGTRHRVLQYTSSQRPDDALLAPSETQP
jgi:hypothetical protein